MATSRNPLPFSTHCGNNEDFAGNFTTDRLGHHGGDGLALELTFRRSDVNMPCENRKLNCFIMGYFFFWTLLLYAERRSDSGTRSETRKHCMYTIKMKKRKIISSLAKEMNRGSIETTDCISAMSSQLLK